MKRKVFVLLSITSMFCFATAVTQILINKETIENKFSHVLGVDPEYSIVLDDTNAASGLTGSYQQLVSENIYSKGDYTLNLNYMFAKSAANAHVVLASHGLIYNQVNNETYANRITSINSIKVDYTSSKSLTIRTSVRNDGKEFNQSQTLLDDTTLSFTTKPYYFIIEAGDAEATINSIVINYSCSENEGINLTDLSGTYTGVGSDSSTYKLVLNGSSATIQSLDKPANLLLNGTAEIISSTQARCTFVYNTYNIYYTVNISEDHRVLAYVSKTDDVGGAAASSVASIDFYKVYSVENFESYSATGDGYTSTRGASSIYSTTGLRAKFYADYYGSNTVPSVVGGSGWSLMGSSDFLNYTANKGHNGSKGASFKSNSNKLRYIQMDAVKGLPSIIGKGAYLSFWAKSYTDSGLSTATTAEHGLKVYAFYNQVINSSNVSVKTEQQLTISSNGDWNRYVMPIDSSKNYYAFGFYCETAATRYIVVDDVEIYTYNPYAEYVAPVSVTGVSLSTNVLEMSIGQSETLTATVAPANATNKNVTFVSSNTSVATVSENGEVTAVSGGNATITVTTADGSFTDTCAVTVNARVNYPEGTFIGTITALGNNFDLAIAIGNESNGLVTIKLSNSNDAGATGITYNKATNQFTITTNGNYKGATYGDITGTYDYENDRLINIACNGSIKSYVTGNGSITASKPAKYFECDGNTAQLQAQWKRRYMNGSWQVDSSNADRFTSDTTNFVSGTGALKRRGYSSNAVSHALNSDFATPITVKNIGFWVYNPSGTDREIRMWIYKGSGLSSGAEIGSVTAIANGWTYCAMGFGQASIYNFQIADFTNSGTYFTFDNIILF